MLAFSCFWLAVTCVSIGALDASVDGGARCRARGSVFRHRIEQHLAFSCFFGWPSLVCLSTP